MFNPMYPMWDLNLLFLLILVYLSYSVQICGCVPNMNPDMLDSWVNFPPAWVPENHSPGHASGFQQIANQDHRGETRNMYGIFVAMCHRKMGFLRKDCHGRSSGRILIPLKTHMLHVWNIYQHLPQKTPKCR